jgi:hypothetical protein
MGSWGLGKPLSLSSPVERKRDSVSLAHEPASVGIISRHFEARYFIIFRGIRHSSKKTTQRCLQMSEYDYRMTLRHFAGESNLQIRYSRNTKGAKPQLTLFYCTHEVLTDTRRTNACSSKTKNVSLNGRHNDTYCKKKNCFLMPLQP